MNKVGIITHYNVHNYGAELQLYGLRMVLKSLDYNSQALQYNKNFDFMEPGIEAKYKLSIKSIPIYLKYLIEKGLGRVIYNVKKKRALSRFSIQNTSIGEFYSRARDLSAIVIGSDEIFSIEAGPNPWYWGIGVQCDKVISYAASFGPTTMKDIEIHRCRELVSAGLSRMNKISVRDENSRIIVKELTGRDAELVCDPVFLYGYENELNRKPREHFPYIIVYSYDDHMNDKETIKAIREFANANNAKVISIGYYHGWCDKNICCDPLDIFPYFRDAIMVFTDTFHGTVFSILSETPMIVQLHGNENKLKYLLSQYDLQNRIVDSFHEYKRIINNHIDFADIKNRIDSYRELSLVYLKNALK